MSVDKTNKELNVPEAFANLEQWETSRRGFLRAAIIAGAASQIAWFTSCSTDLEESNEFLTAEQSTNLKHILMIIFPDDGNGPSADDLNSFGYVMWNMSNEYAKAQENDYIIEGIDHLEQLSKDYFDKSFYEISQEDRELLVRDFNQMKTGNNWMSVMVTFVLESALLDPIYGGNVDEAGWTWLDHVPGNPRPAEGTRLESYIEKYKAGDV